MGKLVLYLHLRNNREGEQNPKQGELKEAEEKLVEQRLMDIHRGNVKRPYEPNMVVQSKGEGASGRTGKEAYRRAFKARGENSEKKQK